MAGKLFFLLALNTVVAILIGLLVANVLRPGRAAAATAPTEERKNRRRDCRSASANIPSSLLKPIVDNNVIV